MCRLTQCQRAGSCSLRGSDDLAARERSRKTCAELPKCWIRGGDFFKAQNFYEFHVLPENMLIKTLSVVALNFLFFFFVADASTSRGH